MAKLASLEHKAPSAAIKTSGDRPDTVTHQGGAGFSRDAKSELYLLAATNMVGEDTFYEAASERDRRFIDLIHQVATEDPDWLARLVPYLRQTMNMRSASIVLAAETVHAKLTRPVPASKVRNRDIISAAISRADEPAEMLGYWIHRYGKHLPMPVKRGVADAVARVYTERNAIKYDGQAQPIRFADVIELVHPTAKAGWQSALFRYLLDERHGHTVPFGEDGTYRAPETWEMESDRVRGYGLSTLPANQRVMALEADAFRESFTPELVESAALTWETASSKYGPLDARFWEAMAPHLGIFALVRNLRNIRDAKVSDKTLDAIRARLVDPDEIAKSRMFPLRFYAAYREVKDFEFARELERAVGLSTANVPSLPGETLILIDVSGSMKDKVGGKHSTLLRSEAAGLFGAVLGQRAEKAHVYAYDAGLKAEVTVAGVAALRVMDAIVELAKVGGGTWTTGSIAQAYEKHPTASRIVVLTDEQDGAGASASFGYTSFASMYNQALMAQRKGDADLRAIKVPIYTFNLAGYRAGALPSGEDKRYTFGGLTDTAFPMLEQLERGRDADWPF